MKIHNEMMGVTISRNQNCKQVERSISPHFDTVCWNLSASSFEGLLFLLSRLKVWQPVAEVTYFLVSFSIAELLSEIQVISRESHQSEF